MWSVLKRQRWWIGRIAVLPLHLCGYAIAVFFLVRLIPGDPVYQIMSGQGVTPERIAAARAALGLSGSIFEQLRTYLGNILTLNFGDSMITGSPVLPDLFQRLPETIELAVVAMIGSVSLTLAAAFIVVFRPGNVVSRILLPYARAAGAVPDFVLGVSGIFLFYSVLHWIPAPLGIYDPLLNAPRKITSFPVVDALLSGDFILFRSMVSHLWLPELVLVLAHSPVLMKLFIRGLEDAVDSPATRFRIASGASRAGIYLSVARRAAPSAIAMLGTLFSFMLGGAVLVEQLFGMPGMGQFVVNAVNTSDLVALEGFLLVVAALALIVFLLVDIVTMVVDPRRRPGRTEGSSS
jgi:ABC-type dipeptide/oligopeptide/nickel transport system permease component